MNAVEMLKLSTVPRPHTPIPGWQPGKKIINPNWMATIYDPMDLGNGRTFPGAQQMDDVDLSAGRYNNPNRHPPTSLPERGYRAPQLYGFPEAVPSGQFNAGHAANAAWRHQMAGRPMPSSLGMPALEGALGLTGTPMPRLGAVGETQMAQALNSWRRNAMRSNPALAKAFKMYSNPGNSNLLGVIGKALTKIR